MSTTKPLPIAPQLAAAPQSSGAAGSKKSPSGGGMTIRTSRHWVLPPRPKPGRKPNHLDAKRCKPQTAPPAPLQPAAKPVASVPLRKSATAPACLTRKQAQAPAPRRQTKTALRKEIQHIRVENSKLKQELGQLVGDLQLLKQRYNSPPPTGRKRHADDSACAFLKFEDEEPPLLADAKMRLTSSVSSCKTVPTDEEDVLTISSSTPNSLISADLQHSSSSVSSASSVNLNPGHVHGKPQLKFLDDYEQMEFYDKYMRMDFAIGSQPPFDEHHLAALDSIKEEENANSDDILNFLESPAQPDGSQNLFDIKKEPAGATDDYLLPHETVSTTISNSTGSNFYMPPSLEELMEEQDGGNKNFTSNFTTNDLNAYEDNLDMLKMEAFDMI